MQRSNLTKRFGHPACRGKSGHGWLVVTTRPESTRKGYLHVGGSMSSGLHASGRVLSASAPHLHPGTSALHEHESRQEPCHAVAFPRCACLQLPHEAQARSQSGRPCHVLLPSSGAQRGTTILACKSRRPAWDADLGPAVVSGLVAPHEACRRHSAKQGSSARRASNCKNGANRRGRTWLSTLYKNPTARVACAPPTLSTCLDQLALRAADCRHRAANQAPASAAMPL